MLGKVILTGGNERYVNSLSDMLIAENINVDVFSDDQVIATDLSNYDLILAETQLSSMTAIGFLHAILTHENSLPVIFVSNHKDILLAETLLKKGANEYLAEPIASAHLADAIKKQVRQHHAKQAKDAKPVDQSMREIYRIAQRVALSDLTVLITGESGTGKEVLSNYVHQFSPRHARRMISINCAAIPETMLESILFGYEKGAFTGATHANAGKFEMANGSTLLLDEISEMDISLQAKLLRVIQERQVERLGSKKLINLDVRIIATTNKDLRSEVNAGNFREDLMYRLNVFPLHVPPLRARPADIIPLANEFMRKHKQRCGYLFDSPPVLASAAKEKLLAYAWHGNVRELENVMQRALILTAAPEIESEAIIFEHSEPRHQEYALKDNVTALPAKNILTNELQLTEQEIIINTLVQNNGNRKFTAEELGISPRTLRYKLSRMRDNGIDIPARGVA